MSPFAVAWMALAGIPWAHSAGSIFAIIKTDPSEPSECFLEEERDRADICHLAPVLTRSRSNRSPRCHLGLIQAQALLTLTE
jgi:hypothetical protein